jgi:WD40 repeat protein
MANNSNEPKEYDAVLGGQNSVPAGGVVLGGMEGVKRRLASVNMELKEAMKYGQEGLDLVIQALQDKSEDIQHAAYLLLRPRGELEVVKQALRQYNPYQRLECIRTLNPTTIGRLTLSPNGQFFASSCSYEKDPNPYVIVAYESFVELWDVRTGKKIYNSIQGGQILSLAFSSVNQSLIIGKSSEVLVRDISQDILYLYGGAEVGGYVTVSPDGYAFASLHHYKTIKLWNLLDVFNKPRYQEPRSRCTLEGHSEVVKFLAFSPDGQTLISCGHGKEIKQWDVSTGELLRSFEQNIIESNLFFDYHHRTAVSVSPDGRVLAAAYDATTKSIKVWNLFTSELLHSFTVVNRGNIDREDIAFSPDSRTLACIADTTDQVKLWDLETGKLLCTLSHSIRPDRVVFSPDGKTLATASDKHFTVDYANVFPSLVKLWRIQGID